MTNELHEEIDKLRMQLVACDCISLCNTPKALEDILDNLHSDYYCVAVRGVIDAVKREIKHREEAEFYKQEVEKLKDALREFIGGPCELYGNAYCVAHSVKLHGGPCPHERAKQLLRIKD